MAKRLAAFRRNRFEAAAEQRGLLPFFPCRGHGAGDPRDPLPPPLSFDGESAGLPLISQTVKATGVDINILAGAIDNLYVSRVGTLSVQFEGSPEVIAASLEMIRRAGVKAEVIWNG